MNNKLRRPTVSYDELQREMRNTEDDDPEFCEWIESISVTKEQLETLISNPDYRLHQPKEQARVGSMFRRPRYGALVLLSRFPSRYTSGWKLLMKTLTGHQRHLTGYHETPGYPPLEWRFFPAAV